MSKSDVYIVSCFGLFFVFQNDLLHDFLIDSQKDFLIDSQKDFLIDSQNGTVGTIRRFKGSKVNTDPQGYPL